MLVVENAGQWPAAARFQVWGSPLSPGTIWLAQDAIWLVVAGGTLPQRQVAGSEGFADLRADLPAADLQPATSHALKLTFPGSNPDVRIEPFEPLTTTVSYFIGNDPEQWYPAVPVWDGLRYVDLYPGVDLVLGGSDGAWRFEAAPGAAVGRVRVQVEGADVVALEGSMLRLAADGEPLSVDLPVAPMAYHVARRARDGDNLELAVFPGSQPALSPHLNDDPCDLLFSTFLGGTYEDGGSGFAADTAGSAYSTGWTTSVGFPVTPGVLDPTYNGA
jgi:hypothetical protein